MEHLITEITPERYWELKNEALDFARENVSINNEQNWETIHQLKFDLLIMEERAKYWHDRYKESL